MPRKIRDARAGVKKSRTESLPAAAGRSLAEAERIWRAFGEMTTLAARLRGSRAND